MSKTKTKSKLFVMMFSALFIALLVSPFFINAIVQKGVDFKFGDKTTTFLSGYILGFSILLIAPAGMKHTSNISMLKAYSECFKLFFKNNSNIAFNIGKWAGLICYLIFLSLLISYFFKTFSVFISQIKTKRVMQIILGTVTIIINLLLITVLVIWTLAIPYLFGITQAATEFLHKNASIIVFCAAFLIVVIAIISMIFPAEKTEEA